MSGHSRYSPSGTDTFAECHGSVTLCDALPDHQKNISGPAAALGTAVHGLIEHTLGKGEEPEAYRGRIIVVMDEGVSILRKSAKAPTNAVWFEVDDGIIEGASMMTDYVRERCKELKLDTKNREELQLESRTNPLPDRDDTSGTADVTLCAWPVELELVDYKNGWNVVEVTSRQVKSYLLGKALEHEFAFGRYKLTIVQPNAEHEDGRRRTIELTADELRAYQAELRGYVEACDKAHDAKGAPRQGFDKVNPAWAKKYLKASTPGQGKDHCMFCDAKPKCPAYLSRVQTAAAMDFDDEPPAAPDVQSEDEVAKILRWKPYMDALFKAAFAFGQRSLENGFKVPGFKLAKTRPHRKLKPGAPDELADAIAAKFKLERDALFNNALKTGPQIEKLFKGKGAAKLKAAFESEFMFRPEGVNVIVPEEDARDEVLKSAGDDFPDDDMDFG